MKIDDVAGKVSGENGGWKGIAEWAWDSKQNLFPFCIHIHGCLMDDHHSWEDSLHVVPNLWNSLPKEFCVASTFSTVGERGHIKYEALSRYLQCKAQPRHKFFFLQCLWRSWCCLKSHLARRTNCFDYCRMQWKPFQNSSKFTLITFVFWQMCVYISDYQITNISTDACFGIVSLTLGSHKQCQLTNWCGEGGKMFAPFASTPRDCHWIEWAVLGNGLCWLLCHSCEAGQYFREWALLWILAISGQILPHMAEKGHYRNPGEMLPASACKSSFHTHPSLCPQSLRTHKCRCTGSGS